MAWLCAKFTGLAASFAAAAAADKYDYHACPQIMGMPYDKRLTQWSKGDYTGANQVSTSPLDAGKQTPLVHNAQHGVFCSAATCSSRSIYCCLFVFREDEFVTL
jgi:hypothetical protein